MKTGRNDPCKCGSGKKFKHCCEGKVAARSLVPPPAEVNALIALYNGRRYAETENRTRALLGQYPDFGFGWKLLGRTLQMQGKDALPAFRRAAELMPGEADAHFNLGTALKNAGLPADAAISYRRALTIKPDFVLAYFNLGIVQKDLGQFGEAAASYRRIVEIKPDFAEAHSNLGNALKELGHLDNAVASYRRAVALKPDFAEAHNNLGIALKELGQLDAALVSNRRALEIEPNFAGAHFESGNVMLGLAQHDNAVTSYRRALEIKPDLTMAHSNLLFALNYTVHTPEYCLEEARQFGRTVAKKVAARFSAWQCVARSGPLRVGLVSGDLRNHPVGFFLEGLLAHIDPARIELVAYPTLREQDGLTARIRPYFSAWKPLFGLSDEAAARLIHADGVHVLLDLSGHTVHNRLPVFAWKPAPVQVSWLGYWSTTGVAEMDYLLADKVGVPEAQRRNFSETVWYMPDTRLCFTAPGLDLPVATLPALQNGYVTFGCFQRLDKAGDEMLMACGKILTALPDAILRWQCKQLGDTTVAAQFAERLQRHGIDPARVSLHGWASREAYLAAHAEVDVMLDTFPYPGGTTTCEALWMGVPTLTLAGETLLSRQGASLLTAAGLENWVALNVADYVDKAVAVAGDLPKLADLRATLRKQVSVSPLFDAPRFARNFEDALWGMWQARAQGDSLTSPGLFTALHDWH